MHDKNGLIWFFLFLQVADGLCLQNAHVVKWDPQLVSDWSLLMKHAGLIIDLENEDDTPRRVCVCVCVVIN